MLQDIWGLRVGIRFLIEQEILNLVLNLSGDS